MKPYYYVAILLLLMASPASAVSHEFSAREHVYATLLLGPDSGVRLVARSLHKTGSDSQEILDLLAEITWSACSGSRVMDADSLSWSGKALGNTKQPRYAALLDYCLEKVNDDKIRKYMKQARDNLTDSPGTGVFEGGKMDLQAIRTAVTKNVSLPARSPKKFDELRKHQRIEDMYALLGPPDEISASSVAGPKVGHGFVRIQTETDALVMGYRGLGAIRFIFRDASNDWLLADATSVGGQYWSPDEGRFVAIHDRIANGNGAQLRDIAGYLVDRGNLSRDVLDRAAHRIHTSRQETNEQLADGLAWLCKVIAKSRDGRYRQFLLDVSTTAASEQLRKYAGKTASSLPEIAGDQYIAASN